MITIEKLKELLNDNKNPFQEKNVDYKIKALTLLRNKIPYDVCKSIICSAEHDKIYLCDVDDIIPYINDDDIKILADCNLFIDNDDCLIMYA